MPDVSRAFFRLDMPTPPEADLVAFARSVFADLDRTAEKLLPFPDYDLYVAVEEGSVKGGAKVWVTAGALYVAIGQFGSFIQGVREISALGRSVATRVINQVADDPRAGGARVRWSRRDSGAVRQIERLFEKVRDRELTPEEAVQRTLELFDDHTTELPAKAEEEIHRAFYSVQRHPEQLLLPLEVAQEPDHAPVPPHRPSIPRDRPLLVDPRLLVEIRRNGKNGQTQMRTLYR